MCVRFSFQHTNTHWSESSRGSGRGRSGRLVWQVQPLIRTDSSEMSPHTHTEWQRDPADTHWGSHHNLIIPLQVIIESTAGLQSSNFTEKRKRKSENNRRLESEMIDQTSPAYRRIRLDSNIRSDHLQTVHPSDLITCRQSIHQIWWERRHRFAELSPSSQNNTKLLWRKESRSRLWY